MRNALAILLFGVATTAGAQSFQFHGFVTAREIYVNAQPSWLQGGAGRFDVGADTVDDHALVNTYNAQAGFDWMPSTWFLVHADGVAGMLNTDVCGIVRQRVEHGLDARLVPDQHAVDRGRE